MRSSLLVLAALLAAAVRPVAAAEPANPKANPAARAVLDYIHSLAGRTNKHILSGQFADFGNGASLRLFERIHERTGQWPAMIGVDYADFGRGSLTYKVPNAACIEYARRGGLVTVSAHLYNPANPKGGGLRDKGVALEELLKPGTETHQRWMQELDLLAEGLQELQAAGVVVLWRPFHEMNGGWFWWGAKEPKVFIEVWRHMFDYFTKTKALDNLLWVYGPNHGPNTAAYYAGDGYVDIVGLDAYTDFVDPEHVRGYAEVAALPKPFGFTEYGPHGPQNPPGNYDYRRFLEGIRTHFPRTSFFKCWNARWSLATNEHTRELLSDPAVVNRDDLPAAWRRSAWLGDARYGVFMHFLPGDSRGLGLVQAFEVEALARQLEDLGAGYFVLTLGQNSGYFNSPNATYDRTAGYAAGERCSTRDLPLDLSRALRPRGIRLMLYLPCQTPNQDARAQAAFGLPQGGQDQPLDSAFATRWAAVIQEWADRYGDRVAGWWFDGGYEHIRFTEEIAQIYAAAVRHGNPHALVTFNPGVKLVRHTQAEDYTAGELNDPFAVVPASRWVDGSQWHALTYLGSNWSQRDTRQPAERWADWAGRVVAGGGALTLDMGPNWDPQAGPIGALAEGQVAQVRAIRDALKRIPQTEATSGR